VNEGPRVLVAPNADAFAALAAGEIARVLRARLSGSGAKESVRLALSGGSTPAPVYELLPREGLDWQRIVIGFADERCVPPGDPQSNYDLVRRTLLEHLPHPPRSVLRMEGEDRDPEAAARRYEARLSGPFDLIVLGVGEDGHTASLFPGDPACTERERRVMAVTGPKAPRARLTLTPRALAEAYERIVLVRGPSKATIVAALLAGADARQYPASLALNGTWVLDREAASELESDRSTGAG
jgi:6-phosphogluconolactonase